MDAIDQELEKIIQTKQLELGDATDFDYEDVFLKIEKLVADAEYMPLDVSFAFGQAPIN